MVEPPLARLAGADLGDIIEHRAEQARIVDAAMGEEGLVLGREEGVDQQRREFVIGELDAPLAGEGLDRIAVEVADVGRQRRLVGEQLLRAGQAGGETDPDRGEKQETGKPTTPRGAPSGARTRDRPDRGLAG